MWPLLFHLKKTSFWGTITGDPGNFPHGIFSLAPAGKTSWAYVAIGSVPSTLGWRCPAWCPDRWLEGWRSQRSKVPKVLIDANVVSFYERFNNHNFDLSHFGGIILFNSLNIFKPPFLGYRLEAWWKKERHQKHEWESTNKARIMFDDVAQYLHLSLLQLWCETRQGVRAWTIPSLTKSFFLQRVSDRIWQLTEILKWYVCMLELTLLLLLLFLVFLVALPLSLPSLLFPFFPHDRLMSKGPVIVPRMAFL